MRSCCRRRTRGRPACPPSCSTSSSCPDNKRNSTSSNPGRKIWYTLRLPISRTSSCIVCPMMNWQVLIAWKRLFWKLVLLDKIHLQFQLCSDQAGIKSVIITYALKKTIYSSATRPKLRMWMCLLKIN